MLARSDFLCLARRLEPLESLCGAPERDQTWQVGLGLGWVIFLPSDSSLWFRNKGSRGMEDSRSTAWKGVASREDPVRAVWSTKSSLLWIEKLWDYGVKGNQSLKMHL